MPKNDKYHFPKLYTVYVYFLMDITFLPLFAHAVSTFCLP